jgi:hypothetical protein
MTVRVDIAQLSQWAHQSLKAETLGQRRLALADLFAAAVRMSLALEAYENNEPLTLPAGLAGVRDVVPGTVLTIVREHCCEDPKCQCHGKAVAP